MNGHPTESFRDQDLWAIVLGGSSGIGMATAQRLAASGLNLLIAHKDSPSAIAGFVGQQFERIQSHGVRLVTYNGNLSDVDDRCDVMELIEETVPKGKAKLLLHSVASGSCRPIVQSQTEIAKASEAIRGLTASLEKRGVPIVVDTLRQAIDEAFHEGGCDALYTLARTKHAMPEDDLTEEDIQKTVYMMGYDILLWSRELAMREILARPSRIIGLTSEGNTRSWRGYAAVSAAKAALEAISRSMAIELAPYGALSCIVQAGVTDTPAGNAIPAFDLIKASARMRNPFGRLTRPEDVADAIFGLCLPLFDWVNGALLTVDGGESIAAGG